MALVLADRVKETTTTTGTGTVTLLGASAGFQSFGAVGDANTTYYTIAGQTGSEWEVGIGTYTSSGTTLSRTTVLSSSNSGSLVNFSAGTKDVFVTYPSSRSVYADGTTLTATNSSILPTTSGGTNLTSFTSGGVVYASSSSALATGSALTFNGSSFGSTSAWSAGNGQIFTDATSGNLSGIVAKYSGSTKGYLYYDNSSSLYNLYGDIGVSLAFYANNAEAMRLTSTGLGIGTSSPNGLFNVKGTNGQVVLANGNTAGGMKITVTNSTFTADGYLAFEGYTKEYGRFDSAGNLGLGVTPSDWSSASRPALQLPNGAALFSRSGSTFLGQNFFYNSSDTGTYIANGFATLYNQTSGQHQWFNAASGTAGNAAGLTQAMTLDASGNLLIGATSSSSGDRLLVSGYTSVSASVSSGIYAGAIGNKDLNFYSNGNSQFFTAARIRVNSDVYTDDGYMSFWTTSNNGANVLTTSEKFRIGSAGQFGIGGANYGTSGQIFTSNGSGAAPSWQTSAAASKSYVQAMSILNGL
jgi:hypothetical protein